MTIAEPFSPDITSELIERFLRLRQDRIAFLPKEMMQFPPRTIKDIDGVPRNTFEYVKTYCPELVKFVKEVESSTAKFFYGAHTDAEWEAHYIYPSLKDKYIEQLENRDSILTVNSDRETTKRWLNNFLEELSKGIVDFKVARPVCLLLGSIGVGKSTFVKFITSIFFADFKRQRIAPARIECRKFQFRVDMASEASRKETFYRYLRVCAVRDLIFFSNFSRANGIYIPSSVPFLDSMGLKEFKAYAREIIASRPEFSEVRQDLCDQLSSLLHTYDWPLLKSWLEGTNDSELDVLIDFYYSKGWSVLYIYDGFDYLSPKDFIGKGDNFVNLNLLGRFIWRERSIIPMGYLRRRHHSHSMVLLRTSTFAHLTKDHRDLYKHDQVERVLISSPSLEDVVLRTTRRIGLGVDFKREDIESFGAIILRMVDAITDEIEGRNIIEMSSLFNRNVRYQLKYLHDLIAELTNDAIRDLTRERQEKIDHHALLDHIGKAFELFMNSKQYRLVEILLCGQNRIFQNSIDVGDFSESGAARSKDAPGDDQPMIERNADSGLLDNIYNYHERGTWGTGKHYLLEKRRILTVLASSGSLSEEEIGVRLATRFGFVSSRLDITLGMLTMVGLVSCESRADTPRYFIEPMGKSLLDSLGNQLVYIEHVFHKTLLPVSLCAHAVDTTRPKGVDDWTYASIVNAYLFLAAVREVTRETEEVMGAEADDRTFDLLLNSISRSIRRVAGADARTMRVDSPVVRAIREIDNINRSMLKIAH